MMESKDKAPSKIKITDVKFHNRLHIYDFVGYDISLPDHACCEDYDLSFEPDDADDLFKSYGRIGQAAAVFGDLEVLQYLSEVTENPLALHRVRKEHKFKLEYISTIAMLSKNWRALKWSVKAGYHYFFLRRWGIGIAILQGANMDILKWLHSQGWAFDDYIFSDAATRGDMEIMKWLREKQCPWKAYTFEIAVEHQNLDMLMWMKKEGCPWNENVFERAATIGNPYILLLLRVGRCPWDSRTFRAAVERGAHLVELIWLHDEKCPWDKFVFIAAVKRGDLEILNWLREKRCPWDGECYRAAVEKKNGKVLRWLREEKCPMVVDEKTMVFLLETVESLLNNHA